MFVSLSQSTAEIYIYQPEGYQPEYCQTKYLLHLKYSNFDRIDLNYTVLELQHNPNLKQTSKVWECTYPLL